MTGIAPRTASAVERGLDETAAARTAALPAHLPVTAWDAERIPGAWLAVLAWALSVDLWDATWEDDRKRRAIAAAIDQHRLKGTPAGLELALDLVGADYEITERPGGARFVVAVHVYNLGSIALDGQTRLIAAINRVKRASVHIQLSTDDGGVLDILVAGGIGAALPAPEPATLTVDAAYDNVLTWGGQPLTWGGEELTWG